MTPAIAAALTLLMVATSFLSGVFGMAGGMVLMGALLLLLTVPEAMVFHAIAQMASNGWRGMLWIRYVRWAPAARFLTGGALAFAVWCLWREVPPKAAILFMLGITPFAVRALPASLRPNPESLPHGIACGFGAMALMLASGVSGPLIDMYFLGGSLDRRQIVATKAVCQIANHLAKLAYFGAVATQAAGVDPLLACLGVGASIVGTTLARPVLDRMTDTDYRLWANRIVTAMACAYLAQAAWTLWNP